MRESDQVLKGSWFQESCIWYSSSRERGSEPVAWRRAGSRIHSWYLGTCSAMYGTRITFSPSRVTPISFSVFLTPGSPILVSQWFIFSEKRKDSPNKKHTRQAEAESNVVSFSPKVLSFITVILMPHYFYSKKRPTLRNN